MITNKVTLNTASFINFTLYQLTTEVPKNSYKSYLKK